MTLDLVAFLVLAALGVLALLRFLPRRRGWDLRNPLVIDGDTVYCGGARFRLHGIDAPEIGQRGGEAAKAHLEQLIGGQAVRAEILDVDRYGRYVARLWGRTGDLCRQMVLDGYALAAFHDDYRSAERLARRQRRGLWSRHGIDSPSRHRRNTRAGRQGG